MCSTRQTIANERQTYCYDPTVATKWQSLAKGIYFTSCLTQCTFLSHTTLLTAGTDGHAVVWPLSDGVSGSPTGTLEWQHPARIHQNSSKTLASHIHSDGTRLIVSGGDDGTLAFLLVRYSASDISSDGPGPYVSPPVVVNRAHGSAITACTVVRFQSRLYVLTSGNDEWVRLWEVFINDTGHLTPDQSRSDKLSIQRISKVKTSVADVSSMAVLDSRKDISRILVCGVGMEAIRLCPMPNEEEMASE